MTKHREELTVEHLTMRANGVSHVGDIRYEAPFVLKGERYSGMTVSRKQGTIFVLPDAILESAPERIEADCSHYGTCAACHLRHVDYEKSVEMKKALFVNELHHTIQEAGEWRAELDEMSQHIAIVPAANPIGYRNNGRFILEGGKLKLHAMLTHDNFRVDECFTVSPGIWNIAKVLEKDLPSSIVHIDIRDNNAGGYLIEVKDKAGAKRLLGASEITYTMEILGQSFRFLVGADSFFQVNTAMAEKLYEAIVQAVPKEGLIYDLYAGTGTIGIIAAKAQPGSEVICMEIGQEMVDLGRRNAAANGVQNVHFAKQDVRSVQLDRKPSCIIVDPPRNGLSRASLAHMMTIESGLFLYVSCNPTTFLRDMLGILPYYQLETLTLYDMMPFTSHMEILSVWKRRAVYV